ncbi:hypothetical protein OPIT5_09195 [Opitutaceae bacterium TAV5]|nr:hypothetical protein OPIT5_09195 [Opitutaceae bacterium TAV5]
MPKKILLITLLSSIAWTFATAALPASPAATPATNDGKTVFHVDDFGAKPDDAINDCEAIRSALKAAIEAGPGAQVVFSPGTYRVGLSEKELAEKPVQTTKAFNKRHFTYFDLGRAKGIHLKGDGTQLLVTDPRAVLFDFQGSLDCTLSGVTIDLDPLPFTQGKILAVNRNARTFDIEIPDGFPLLGTYPWLTFGPQSDWQNRLIIFGESSRENCDRARRGVPLLQYEFRPRLNSVRDILSFEKTGARTFRITSRAPLDEAVTAGRTLVYSSKVGGGPLIEAGGQNVRLEDVTVHASPGFVVSASSADNLQLKRFAARLKPGRLVVGTSDCIHVRATRGGPRVEDSFFEGIQDDMFNISGNPLPINKITSATEILVDRSVNSAINRGRVAEGDTVYAYAVPEARIKGEARVLRLDQPGGSKAPKRILLDRPIPGLQPDDLLYSREAGNPGAVIRNSTFRGGLRSAIMHMAGDGTLIEGNTFENMHNAIALRQSIGSTYNGQGGMVRNITIRNNVFRGCHMRGVTEHINHPDAAIGVMLFPDSTSRQIDNVLIEGNRIFEPGVTGIWLSNVTGAIVRNNEIVAYPDSERFSGPEQPQRRALRIHNCENVVVDGLVVREPRLDLAAAISIDSASSRIDIKNTILDIGRAVKIRRDDNPPLKPVVTRPVKK